MEFDDILAGLSTMGRLPEAAIDAARARHPGIVPRFIDIIDGFVDDGTNEDAVFLIFHLFGEWRETAAYRPLARLLQCDVEKLESAIGDATTSTAARIMAAVFDGDPRPLYDIILNLEADEHVRSEMCEVLALLVVRGQLDRDEAARFLRYAYVNILPQATSFVWFGWSDAVAVLGLEELRSEVKQAYDRRFILPDWSSYDHFERDLRHAIANPAAPWSSGWGSHEPFDDVVEELSGWAVFNPAEDPPPRPEPAGRSHVTAEPAINLFRNVGRNDPCPCGSGKKFKKCCLRNQAAGG